MKSFVVSCPTGTSTILIRSWKKRATARSSRLIGLRNAIDIPKRLCEIVNKAIAPQPSDRYQSVLDLQQDVREFLRGGLYLPHKTFAPGSLIIQRGGSGRQRLHDRERPMSRFPHYRCCRRNAGARNACHDGSG